MKQQSKELTKEEQKIAAKSLGNAGYSDREIEALIGVDHVTAWRARQEATPDELKQFETDFSLAITEMKRQGIALVQKRLLELIPRERRIDQVVKAGEYLEGKSDKSGLGVSVKSGDVEIKVISYKDNG
jgi:hypothetical protein